MSNEQKYSPGPYSAEIWLRDNIPCARVLDANSETIADCIVWVGYIGPEEFEQAAANATFIARACNSYDELREACKLAEPAIASLMDELGGTRATDWGLVNDALVKIERLNHPARAALKGGSTQ